MDAVISATPAPPYYAVIFTSKRTESDNGYAAMAEKLMSLAQLQSGFLGAESVRDTKGIGITISYWNSLEAVTKFKEDLQHRKAQQLGKKQWYSAFGLRVCKVERDTFFS
jgi:heme-degrading monooxygenase HmoA